MPALPTQLGPLPPNGLPMHLMAGVNAAGDLYNHVGHMPQTSGTNAGPAAHNIARQYQLSSQYIPMSHLQAALLARNCGIVPQSNSSNPQATPPHTSRLSELLRDPKGFMKKVALGSQRSTAVSAATMTATHKMPPFNPQTPGNTSVALPPSNNSQTGFRPQGINLFRPQHRQSAAGLFSNDLRHPQMVL